MKNSKLFVFPAGMWLEYLGSEISECSVYTDIETMSDNSIAQHILLCNKHGFYPEIIMSPKLKVA